MVEEEGMTVDQDAFTNLMQEQRQRARKAREALGDLGWSGVDLGQEMPETKFVGYTEYVSDAKVLAIIAEEEQRQDMVSGVEAIVVLDQTPFYAEMGGQVGDHGVIVTADGEFEVRDVQKNKGGKYLHYGVMKSGSMKVGDTVTAKIDRERRAAIARAHSATHLLQAALEKTLGEHCHQAGSLVEPDHLRFDFTHFSAVSHEELAKVSGDVMNAVLDGTNIDTMVLPIDEAKKLGATALFGEKYGDIVRVVKMGEHSLEFCGGTHLDNTAKVGMFRIVSEASVASGVRRIEAYTGREVLRQMEQMNKTILEAADALKTTPKDLLVKAAATMQEIKEAKQAVDRLKDKLFSGEIERTLFAAKNVAGLKVVTVTRSDIETNDLRKMGDFLKDKASDVVALLAAVQGEKITLNAVCGKDAIAKGIKAGDIIKNLAPICGGKGGGKPDSAMGGGTDVLKLDDMMAALDDFVASNAK